MNDRKKLATNSADPQNQSEWRGCLKRRLVKQAKPLVEGQTRETLGRGKQGFKMMMIMMMMMMMMMMDCHKKHTYPGYREICFHPFFLHLYSSVREG